MRAIVTGLLASAFCLACEPAANDQSEFTGGGGTGPNHFGISTQPMPPRQSELSGGTLTLDATGIVAAVSDADRDQVVVLDVNNGVVRNRLGFAGRSRPGRGTLDGDGNFVIPLRGAGAVVTLSSRSGALLARRDVCTEPVGVAWDAARSALLVACATGELVTLPQSVSAPAVFTTPAPDLRDVVVQNGHRWLTSFRSARVTPLADDGTPGPAVAPPSNAIGTATFVPAVGWQTRGLPGGGLVLAHQRLVTGDIAAIQVPAAPTTPAYYTNSCTSPVARSAVTVFSPEGAVQTSFEVPGTLPVDIAVTADGTRAALVLAGAHRVSLVSLEQGPSDSTSCSLPPAGAPLPYEPIAAAWGPDGTLVVQSHNPPELVVYPADPQAPVRHLPFADPPQDDTAYSFFHASVGGLACASCHPEGRDDGHTWTFTEGKVRTQSLAGGLSATAPYHWQGNFADLPSLLAETFVKRMGGTTPDEAVTKSLATWLDQVPAPGVAKPIDADGIGRGKQLFTGLGGCNACHAGALLTDARTLDVGTGGKFQVPSLKGLRSRGPWMHDGCASALSDRFVSTCGGTAHGGTASLDANQRTDLITYLESL